MAVPTSHGYRSTPQDPHTVHMLLNTVHCRKHSFTPSYGRPLCQAACRISLPQCTVHFPGQNLGAAKPGQFDLKNRPGSSSCSNSDRHCHQRSSAELHTAGLGLPDAEPGAATAMVAEAEPQALGINHLHCSTCFINFLKRICIASVVAPICRARAMNCRQATTGYSSIVICRLALMGQTQADKQYQQCMWVAHVTVLVYLRQRQHVQSMPWHSIKPAGWGMATVIPRQTYYGSSAVNLVLEGFFQLPETLHVLYLVWYYIPSSSTNV